MTCREQGFHVTTMQAVYERMLGRVPVDHIGRNITAVLPEDDRGPGERLYVLGKRAVDFIVASVALILLAMVVPLVALLNLTRQPGAAVLPAGPRGPGGTAVLGLQVPDHGDGCGEGDGRASVGPRQPPGHPGGAAAAQGADRRAAAGAKRTCAGK